ncbi:MAG: redoxin domain-containing protein [Anaerolineales bacterium]|nr:redoxin domain-containing protein [Anaerolineales bacterium]
MQAWAENLGKITFPLLSDFYPHGQVAQVYGVLRLEGTSERAIFIIDKQGVIRYIDVHDIDDQPDNEVLFRELAAVAGVAVPPPVQAEAVEPAEVSRGPKKVVMYCTAWCPACRRARAYLKIHGVDFEEIDITRDREAAARLRGWANGNETTPTFDIEGTIIVNFNRFRLNEMLGISE